MWIPFKKHSHRPTWGNLIFDIIIPGIITFYLVSTEHAFIESFNEEMEILLYGEMLFLGFHTILTYFILPAIWFVDLMLFTGRFYLGTEIHHDILHVLASILYVLIGAMMLVRIFY
jgi:hypothetical protein